jgi:hypothetical protein
MMVGDYKPPRRSPATQESSNWIADRLMTDRTRFRRVRSAPGRSTLLVNRLLDEKV